LTKNASMSPLANTSAHGCNINLADLSDGCQPPNADPSFLRIIG